MNQGWGVCQWCLERCGTEYASPPEVGASELPSVGIGVGEMPVTGDVLPNSALNASCEVQGHLQEILYVAFVCHAQL